MGTVHKLSMDLFEEAVDAFTLLAIHSNMEDFSLAYALNSQLGFCLARTSWNLELGEANFPVFEWIDTEKLRNITLIGNVFNQEVNWKGQGLFEDDISLKKHRLIPELKKVDYFLKLEQDSYNNDITNAILAIPKVITAYTVATENLKSKNNLIF